MCLQHLRTLGARLAANPSAKALTRNTLTGASALALAVSEQALQVDGGPARLVVTAEVVAEQGSIVTQPSQDGFGKLGGFGLVHTPLDVTPPHRVTSN